MSGTMVVQIMEFQPKGGTKLEHYFIDRKKGKYIDVHLKITIEIPPTNS